MPRVPYFSDAEIWTVEKPCASAGVLRTKSNYSLPMPMCAFRPATVKPPNARPSSGNIRAVTTPSLKPVFKNTAASFFTGVTSSMAPAFTNTTTWAIASSHCCRCRCRRITTAPRAWTRKRMTGHRRILRLNKPGGKPGRLYKPISRLDLSIAGGLGMIDEIFSAACAHPIKNPIKNEESK